MQGFRFSKFDMIYICLIRFNKYHASIGVQYVYDTV